MVHTRDGHGSGSERMRSPATLFRSGFRFEFLEKTGSGFDMNGMVYIECSLYKSMAEMGTEPDSESKIWRLTGSGVGFGILVFGSGFGVNFSDSVHPSGSYKRRKLFPFYHNPLTHPNQLTVQYIPYRLFSS